MPRESLFTDPGDEMPYVYPEPPRPVEEPAAPPEPEGPPEPEYADAPHPGTLRAASFGTALTLVAFTMPLGLLATIVPELQATEAGRTWILSSMSVGLAAGLLVSGAVADDFGRRRVFLAGLVVFAFGSFLAAVAGNVSGLAIGRAVEGLGGAAMLSSSLALIAYDHPPGPGRMRATGIWGAMLGLGIAIGPIAAALLDQLAGWHAPYVVLTGVSLVAIRPCARALRESRSSVRRPLDVLGATLLAGGLATLTTGIVQGNASGWGSGLVVFCLLAAVALLWWFLLHESRTRAPLFDVGLLGTPAFVGALAGSFALGFTAISFMSYVMTFMRLTLGVGPVAATLWGAPWAVLSFLVAMRARGLGKYLAPHVQVGIGLSLCGVGLLSMIGLDGASRPADLLPGLVVMGIGTGMLNAALAQAAVTVVPPHRAGMGAGANNTARYLGAALGVALVVGLLHSGTERRANEILGGILEPSIAQPLAKEIADGGALTSVFDFDPDALAVIERVERSAGTSGMNTVLLVIAMLAFASAAFCSALLRPARGAAEARAG